MFSLPRSLHSPWNVLLLIRRKTTWIHNWWGMETGTFQPYQRRTNSVLSFSNDYRWWPNVIGAMSDMTQIITITHRRYTGDPYFHWPDFLGFYYFHSFGILNYVYWNNDTDPQKHPKIAGSPFLYIKKVNKLLFKPSKCSLNLQLYVSLL